MPHPTPIEGEPTFELMARDPFAPALIRLWATHRRLDVRNGSRPVSDLDQIERAERTAERMEEWRRDADEAWRTQPELPLAEMASYDGWIEWEGKGLAPSGDILYRLRDGTKNEEPLPAVSCRWDHQNWPGDIVAYKVVD